MLETLIFGAITGLIGFFMVRWLTRGLLDMPEAMISQINWMIYRKWQGRYYAFDGRQVRFCVTATDVWLAESDILRLLDPKASATELRAIDAYRAPIPGHGVKGIRLEGVQRLLRHRVDRRAPSRDMVRLDWWLANEAIPNVTRFPDSSM